LVKINPLQAFFWTFRRNEKDVVNLYNSLSQLMQLATESNMLNFGYWKEKTRDPIEAQNELCSMVGEMSDLSSSKKLLDVGSGFSAPAIKWKTDYDTLGIICINTNFKQLLTAQVVKGITRVNATSLNLPFSNKSVDRIIALESAQHFKPLSHFISESKRVLKQNGILVLAFPVILEKQLVPSIKLGVLSLSWLSEHYSLDYVKSLLEKEGFVIIDIKNIGSNVYPPLADYYIQNRESIKNKILKKYPAYLEKILFKSLVKMKKISQEKIIDYTIIKCRL
jgi:cyclopropane fatty-acyl-phospholipid synthase-like methyltransferase